MKSDITISTRVIHGQLQLIANAPSWTMEEIVIDDVTKTLAHIYSDYNMLNKLYKRGGLNI